jgi:hypothetical protein
MFSSECCFTWAHSTCRWSCGGYSGKATGRSRSNPASYAVFPRDLHDYPGDRDLPKIGGQCRSCFSNGLVLTAGWGFE